MDGGDSTSSLADAELRAGGQQQLGIDQDVAVGDLPIGVGEKLDLPLASGVLNARISIAEKTFGVAGDGRPAVQRVERFRQRTNRLLLKNWNDWLPRP